jgi:hypothetical protein
MENLAMNKIKWYQMKPESQFCPLKSFRNLMDVIGGTQQFQELILYLKSILPTKLRNAKRHCL